MGLYLSAQRRKSGKASYHAHWQGNTLAQVHARPMCVGSGTHQRQLPYAQFHRIRSRRGPKKAIIAIAASMLSAIYHMLKDGTMYQDLGANHFDSGKKPPG
jgi:transposase